MLYIIDKFYHLKMFVCSNEVLIFKRVEKRKREKVKIKFVRCGVWMCVCHRNSGRQL